MHQITKNIQKNILTKSFFFNTKDISVFLHMKKNTLSIDFCAK